MKKILGIIFLVFLILVGVAFAAGTILQLRPVTVQDMGGPPMAGVNAPTYVDARVLAASTAESHTIPTGAKYVLFSSTANFYACFMATSTVPSDDITNGTAGELNPTLREITGLGSFSLISPSSCIITMAFYK